MGCVCRTVEGSNLLENFLKGVLLLTNDLVLAVTKTCEIKC